MNFRNTFIVLAIILTGCAQVPPQKAVPFAITSVKSPANKLGVMMSALPKVETQFPGAYCLLCMAAASVANSSLTAYTQKLPYEDLGQLKEQVIAVLAKKGASATIITDNIDVAALPDFGKQGANIARKDFTALKAKYNIDKLLVIDIKAVGIHRPYSAYVPTSEPKAVVNGFSYIINLTTNTYEWYVPLTVSKAAENNKWDEAPNFPGLTNAYFQALETAKDSILLPLAN